ncbi:hypothetical protein D9619_004419 [Psilocybe cf. subviscida]|uniref:Ig-like domain-containing protein n=1 Tax=Psilocybe cf. subviscida TaxID=2480587 RepID=A0A8H5BPJ7_9AGAR|nr:hypothetical protein D9619_004419 [Psilocybe cf. subviscida]
MQFTTGLVSLLAAVSAVAAVPWRPSTHAEAAVAPVPVTKLVCDGDSFKCTASLDFGDGRWVAQWTTSVFHTSLFESQKVDMRALSMAPVPVTQLNCDGDTFLCTANLNFGDGNWVAQWPTSVFHNGAFGRKGEMDASAPVPANNLVCDGDSFKCTANLDFGDGRWVAQWTTSVFHTSGFLDQH